MTESPAALAAPRSTTTRRLIASLDVVLPIAGVLIVLAAVVFVSGRWSQLWVAIAGLVVLEAGVWKLASRILHERRYLALREEVQRFVGYVRVLNRSAVELKRAESGDARQTFDEAASAMHASLDRMMVLAGKTEEDLKKGA